LCAAADSDVAECDVLARRGKRCWCWGLLASMKSNMGVRADVPIGRTTLERSQRPFVFFSSSMTALGKSCLGSKFAIESAT
jgi:hypothetical protein